ncbi:g10 protein, putative [Perkinsus marinus ATCC 50983]|uniref:G10 protein, putative n=1 Tax=Perkinsus marinus (strain ATCC 50983 / TXsc) TaxID=423536 RepID=C5KL26_PERM5|nr:g10 protein, putative [Perkinsus marinus ATCC 50983]EER14834.1 g10 protein, putative [Perkinsus marinus ATCC 50983]|eukprot:XP_002783038.1 g10 protein, putative [Perkinsus marinus ATCC 50983]
MPKVRTLRSKKAPEGWEEIESTLMEIDRKMRDAENEPHEDKRKTELLWPIHKLNHQRSRYVFDMYYKKKAISKELFRYCLDEGWADKQLVYKWRKPGGRRAFAGYHEVNLVRVKLYNVPIVDAEDALLEINDITVP